MSKFVSLVAAATFALTASAVASAADNTTLRVDSGSVMTSQGGEFAAAQSGQTVVDGERLMVTEGSAATVLSDECRKEYTKPGVYVIGCDRNVAAYGGSGSNSGAAGTNWAAAGMIAAGVAVGAAALANMDEVEGPRPASR